MARTPGWYPHPEQRQMLRWWDGAAWTGHIAAEPPPGSPPPPPPGELSWPGSHTPMDASVPIDASVPMDAPVELPPPPPGPPSDAGMPPPMGTGAGWPSGDTPARTRSPVIGVVVTLILVVGGALFGVGASLGWLGGPDEETAKATLRDIAVAQELHHTTRGSYASSISALGVDVDEDVEAVIARVSDDGFCAEASLRDSTRTWRWDTRFGTVEEGRCPV